MVQIYRFIFFHPDFTVGFGISPNRAIVACGLYRRSGISPCPEDYYLFIIALYIVFVNTQLHVVKMYAADYIVTIVKIIKL